MKEIGEYLKENRTKHGVSTEEAANDLNVKVSEIENIESGNVKAFKDVYALKELIKTYAKYLGIEEKSLMDEFNDFLFEKTSKISLEAIKKARKQEAKEKKKINSPYTLIPKKKINIAPIVLGVLIAILLLLIIYLILRGLGNIGRENTNELSGGVRYEYTY